MKNAALLVSIMLLASLLAPSLVAASISANQTTPEPEILEPVALTNSTDTQVDDLARPTGLKEETEQGLDWMGRVFPAATSIRINELALERINEERAAAGLEPLDASQVSVAPFGLEAELPGSTPSRMRLRSTLVVGDVLPGSVDNSESIAFPVIGDQGALGSCAAFSTTYYQFTYEQNLVRGRDASGGDLDVTFSPKWTYNLINDGVEDRHEGEVDNTEPAEDVGEDRQD